MERRRSSWAAIASLSSLALACGSPNATSEDVAREQAALNACGETVPDERIVDGIPAYAQCDGVSSGDIWSNNGVDTSSTSGGDDWFRTQRGGGYQCTELARRYLYFVWDINYQHGNAQEWCDGELPPTLTLSTTPVHGDLIVFEGGVCGAAQSTGHIALVDEVDTEDASVTFIEQNRAGRRSSDIDCAKCFLHVVANDGTGAGGMTGAGGASAGGSAGAAGMTGGSGEGGVGASAGEPGSGGNGGGAGGAGGSGMEPPQAGSAGAPSGGAAGSMMATGGTNAGGAGTGAGGTPAGGSTSASGGAGVGGSAAGQSGAAGSAGSAAGIAGSDGVAPPADADEAQGMSCSTTGARGGGGGAGWLAALAAVLVLRLRRRSDRRYSAATVSTATSPARPTPTSA
jgi:MYXO-CTERM domain-containing protein